MKSTFTIGTRGSDLALWQARFVKSGLEANFPSLNFEIKVITTTGDRMLDVALSKIGDKGLFTRQIENELLDGTIDFAVHSLKDLQTSQPEGLTIGAVCKRESPSDALISPKFATIDDLPAGAIIATGSLRRRSQLLHYRPDLKIVEIRGNVSTRLQKLNEPGVAGMILAAAGVMRLGLDSHISQLIPHEIMLPAVGQGAVAIEIRTGDADGRQLAAGLNDAETFNCVTAERAFLRRLEGGCQVPIGGFARLENGRIFLEGLVGSLDGQIIYRDSGEGESGEAEKLGTRIAEVLISRGAGILLDEARLDAARSTEAVI